MTKAGQARLRGLVLLVLLACWLTCIGRSVAAQTPAQRIVSTSPSITETLFALGLGERVIGVSAYCRFPEAATRLPKVGTFLKPNAEIIARLHPDLVVVHQGPNDVSRQLSVLGIRSVSVDRGTLASVFSSIEEIGAASGERRRAADLVRDVRARLEGVRARAAGRSPKKVLIIVGRRPGMLTDLIAVGAGSYLSDLVEIAGGVNALGSGAPEYPRISMETVIRLAPDVIVDAGDKGDTEETRQRRSTLTLALWQGQSAVVAVRQGAVHAAMSDAFVVPGPRVVDVAETVAAWIRAVSP